MNVWDIKVDDPFSVDGDFNIQDANSQNIQAILIAQQGQIYVWPDLGVNLRNYLLSPQTFTGFKATVIEELAKDDYQLLNFELIAQAGDVTIDIDAQKVK